MGIKEEPSDYLNRIAKHPRLSRHGGPSSVEQNDGKSKLKLRALEDGNWVCEDASCQNINYPRRVECHKCGKKRGPLGDAVVKAYVDGVKMQRGERVERGERGDFPSGLSLFPSHEVIGGIMGRGILGPLGGGEGGGGGGGGGGGMGMMVSPPPPPLLGSGNPIGGQEFWAGNMFENTVHHPLHHPVEGNISSQYVAGEGGRRSTLSAATEGKRLAEQLVGLFANSSDPIGDAGECLASATLWLQTMKTRIQIPTPSPLDPSHSLSLSPPPGAYVSQNPQSVILSTPNFMGYQAGALSNSTPLNSTLNTPINNSLSNLLSNSMNTLTNNSVNNNNNNNNNNILSRNLAINGVQSVYGTPTNFSGSLENSFFPSNGQILGAGGGVGGVGLGVFSPSFSSPSSGMYQMRPMSVTNVTTMGGGGGGGGGGRVLFQKPNVKFNDYKDRPSEYLREFGDPAAVTASAGSANQRPEPGVHGNWECEDCKNINFPRRTNCFQCHKKRGTTGDDIVREYVRKLIEGN